MKPTTTGGQNSFALPRSESNRQGLSGRRLAARNLSVRALRGGYDSPAALFSAPTTIVFCLATRTNRLC
jgi:hypothetical protein